MDRRSQGSKADHEDDVDVDHYFLPGGILDSLSNEEDMIGGSLLDEIGGVGSVPLVPPRQTNVSRILGARSDSADGGAAGPGSESNRQRESIERVGPARLSVEGTNPMAKEFTPSAQPASADIALEPREVISEGYSHTLPSLRVGSNSGPGGRVFSAAVGSGVKPPPERARQAPPRQAGLNNAPQLNSQAPIGDRGQSGRNPPGTRWAAIVMPANPGLPLASTHRAATGSSAGSQAHRTSSSGLASQGAVQQRSSRMRNEGGAGQTGPVPRHGGSGVNKNRRGGHQDNEGPLDTTERTKGDIERTEVNSRPGRQQRKSRGRIYLRQVQAGERSARIGSRSSTTGGSSSGRCDRLQEQLGGAPRPERDVGTTTGSGRSKTKSMVADLEQDHRSQSRSLAAGLQLPTKQTTQESGWTSRRACGDDATPSKAPDEADKAPSVSSSVVEGKVMLLEEPASPRPTTLGHKEDVSVSADGSTTNVGLNTGPSALGASGRWASVADRQVQQAQVPKETIMGKMKSKRKEERFTSRAFPKQPAGAGGISKDVDKGRRDMRSRLAHGLGLLSANIRISLRASATALLRASLFQLTRLRLIGRLFAVLSFLASLGASVLAAMVSSMSSFCVLWLRVHSLALKEAMGSLHVAVCFLFPYSFRHLVSLIDEWAPHWLPACLWYSFLMQMFCTSTHLHKRSASSHAVPALRALLPVAFLCEVPSSRSYLLALGGSELLLLSFTLAAVRLRCLLSPIFLCSWSCQVIVVSSLGSSPSIQYSQLLVSLATLHAISMVDVMLNSRLYHARYRAGMSLTNGFRSIAPPSHKLLR